MVCGPQTELFHAYIAKVPCWAVHGVPIYNHRIMVYSDIVRWYQPPDFGPATLLGG